MVEMDGPRGSQDASQRILTLRISALRLQHGLLETTLAKQTRASPLVIGGGRRGICRLCKNKKLDEKQKHEPPTATKQKTIRRDTVLHLRKCRLSITRALVLCILSIHGYENRGAFTHTLSNIDWGVSRQT